jgi:steroid delta-isomerase-like uncharacterized protein
MTWTDDDLMALLRVHTDAWNAHDIDALMELFAEDCVFEASGGNEATGDRHVGKEQVRAAFSAVFESMPDAMWGGGRHRVIDSGYGVSEWTLTGTRLDGTRIEVNGCDFLTVVDGAITSKNSFRKHRPPLPSSGA